MNKETQKLYDQIQEIHGQLHRLSDEVANQRDNKNINWHYLSGKTLSLSNTAKHVQDQVKHLTK